MASSDSQINKHAQEGLLTRKRDYKIKKILSGRWQEQKADTPGGRKARKGKTESHENQKLCLHKLSQKRRARLEQETPIHKYILHCFRGCESLSKKTNNARHG